MSFQRPLIGISQEDIIRSTDVKTQLETGRMVEEIRQYQRKRRNHIERMPPERGRHILSFYWKTGDIGRPRKRWALQFL
jgi:hypothetical protein